ncbi:hypothetical protein F4781DRAFT_429310 [Annulohypoxylon bovei var. microspora]|nr:hypothetical protein F4781DRAFT_429310 [Annulohypoxylon bovei var. microspora]
MSTTAGAFVAGGIAACGAVTATHPFETVKIRYADHSRLHKEFSYRQLASYGYGYVYSV